MRKFWESRFDRVTAICHTAYAPSRSARLAREFRRVGLDGVAGYRWTFPSPFLMTLARSIRLDSSIRHIGNVDVMVFGFYAELKTALALGAERVLVLEDDVRFTNDMDMVRSAIDAIPDDFHEAHLSWLLYPPGAGADLVLGLPRVGGSWVVAGSHVRVRDSSATVFSRAGMTRFVELVESSLGPTGRGLVCCDVTDYPDMLRDGGCHTLLSIPLLARQDLVGDRMSARDFIPEYRPFCADNDVSAFGGGGVR